MVMISEEWNRNTNKTKKKKTAKPYLQNGVEFSRKNRQLRAKHALVDRLVVSVLTFGTGHTLVVAVSVGVTKGTVDLL